MIDIETVTLHVMQYARAINSQTLQKLTYRPFAG
jgi:hypothetical protein